MGHGATFGSRKGALLLPRLFSSSRRLEIVWRLTQTVNCVSVYFHVLCLWLVVSAAASRFTEVPQAIFSQRRIISTMFIFSVCLLSRGRCGLNDGGCERSSRLREAAGGMFLTLHVGRKTAARRPSSAPDGKNYDASGATNNADTQLTVYGASNVGFSNFCVSASRICPHPNIYPHCICKLFTHLPTHIRMIFLNLFQL
jgi:hypothetical protein